MKRLVLLLALALAGLPGLALADQTSPNLVDLFEALLRAPNVAAARPIEQSIWQTWLDYQDDEARSEVQRSHETFSEGDPYIAVAILDKVIAKHPDWAEAWNRRATYYYVLGRYDKSIADVQHVLELEPKHFGAMAGLGAIYIALGEDDKALRYYEMALNIHPQMQAAQHQAEVLRERLGPAI
jgi:tetratricopeptide (TPR) repeat protein